MSKPLNKDQEMIQYRKEEEQYWADVKAGKQPDPIQAGLMKNDSREKAEILKENLALTQATNRMKVIVEKLTNENTELKQQLETYKVRLADAKAPKKSTQKK